MVYNGNPAFRIWPRGTRRLLGVVSDDDDENGEDWERLPPNLRQHEPTFGMEVWGHFRVCPRTPERPGWMRMVVLTEVRDFVIVDHRDEFRTGR